VEVYVPPGWSVDFSDDNEALLSDGNNNFAYARAEPNIDPSADAGQLLAQNLEVFFPPENYTQFKHDEITPLKPFGSVVSTTGMHYEAIWVDNQGSFSLHGVAGLSVRQDGTILMVSVEHAPVEDWDNKPPSLGEILVNSMNRFGGVA